MADKKKMSYSKVETYEQCGWKYLLQYVEGPYISTPGIALDVGNMIHDAEEKIANAIKAGNPIDYVSIKNGIILKSLEIEHKFPKEWNEIDKSGRYYKEKIKEYLTKNIYRLENFMKAHPTYEIVGAEIPFNFDRFDYHFNGKIDRVFRNTATGEYICQDIKTWPELKDEKELVTPLQFVVYTIALKETYPDILTEEITCQYDLPFCDATQNAGTKGFVNRGIKKLEKLITGINNKDFKPHPTPLCYWCTYCDNNPNQPKDPNARGRCPYFCHYTKERQKDFSVENEWQGLENHQAILENYLKNKGKKTV